MLKIRKYIIENISLSYLDFSKDIKEISKKDYLNEQVKDIFIDFNIGSLLLSSSMKNELDEVSFSLYNLDYIKEMIIYIRKEKDSLLYSSNISFNNKKLSSPYLVENTLFNSKNYSSTTKVRSRNIESTLNKFILDSIQSKSFIRLFNNKGIYVSIIGNNKSKVYNQISTCDKTSLFSNSEILDNEIFSPYEKKLISQQEIKNKCICSYEKCIEIVSSLVSDKKDDIFSREKEIELSCPICGKKYIIKEKDILNQQVSS